MFFCWLHVRSLLKRPHDARHSHSKTLKNFFMTPSLIRLTFFETVCGHFVALHRREMYLMRSLVPFFHLFRIHWQKLAGHTYPRTRRRNAALSGQHVETLRLDPDERPREPRQRRIEARLGVRGEVVAQLGYPGL